MQQSLKGPIPGIAVYLVLLLGAHGGVGADTLLLDLSETGPFVLSGQIGEVLGNSDPMVSKWSVLTVLAIGASLLFACVLSWTGNRIVGFLAGATWVVHPALTTSLSAADAMVRVLPAVFVLGALEAREAAWRARAKGAPPLLTDALTLVLSLLAILAGPAGLAVGIVLPLSDFTFHRSRVGRAGRAVLCSVPLAALAFWLLASGYDFHAGLGFSERVSRAVFLPVDGQAATLVATVLGIGGAGLLGAGWRSLGRGPKWIVIYAGFGMGFLFGTEFSCLAYGGSGTVLGLAGLSVLAPAIAWRYLLQLIPETTDRQGESGRPRPDVSDLRVGLDESGPRSVSHPMWTPPGEQVVSFPSEPEVRRSVEVAVEAAVGAAVRAVLPAAGDQGMAARKREAPGRRYGEEWDRYAAEWTAKETRRSGQILGQEWSDARLERSLFANYCHPWLAPTSTVLEIGQGGGKFTRLIAPAVAHVVCLDVSRAMLERARGDLGGLTNVSYVLSDGRGLASLVTGSMDFAFSYDVFVHLDQEDMFLYLEDLGRVLRPGGKAVISFANLLDPLGFRQFAKEAGRHGTDARAPGRINFLSPDIVRTLVTSAGLALESLHLAANNRDMIAILERPVS